MNLKQIIDNTLSQSQINALPNELAPIDCVVWKHDLDNEKDWDDFTNGISTAHIYLDNYIDPSFKALVDVTNLSYGNNINSIYGMLGENEQIIIYTREYKDLTGKFITFGEDKSKIYLAISFELNNFTLKNDKKTNLYLGKIILVDIVKFMDSQLNSGEEGPCINIKFGKLWDELTTGVRDATFGGNSVTDGNRKQIKDPDYTKVDPLFGEPNDKSLDAYNGWKSRVKAIEIMIPKPAILVGGFDILTIDKIDDTTQGKTKIKQSDLKPSNITDASTKPKTFPINENYCIAPIQFKVPSVDNYGMTHPLDSSNAAKMLSAMQSIGSNSDNATGVAQTGGVISSLTSKIVGSTVGLAQKYFGDKGTLANSTAINGSMVQGDGDAIKLFIQGDAWAEKQGTVFGGNNVIKENGYFDISQISTNNDYMELNQGNGEFGKYGKSMSPSMNGEFNHKNYIRGIGVNSMKWSSLTPFLSVPFVSDAKYNDLKNTDAKFKDYLIQGTPRRNIGMPVQPMFTIDTWPVYIRNMFFRPDPYSFFNWSALMPSEIGIYSVEQNDGIAYDISSAATDTAAALWNSFSNFTGIGNTVDTRASVPDSYSSKTIPLSKLSDNSIGDPSLTFTSLRYELDDAIPPVMLRAFMFTTSTIHVKALDKDDKVIEEWRFNSKGSLDGTSASVNNYWRL